MVGALSVLAMWGCVSSSPKQLTDNESRLYQKSYAAKNVSDSKQISMDFVPPQYGWSGWSETNILGVVVTELNAWGDSEPIGWLDFGGIVEREFKKVVEWNFALPPVSVPSTAEFLFNVDRVSLRKEKDDVIALVELSVKVGRVGHVGEIAYERTFSATRRGPWRNKRVIPESLYAALDETVARFLDDWGNGRAVLALKKWGAEPPGPCHVSGRPSKPPTVESCWFTNKNGVCCGTCQIACNDYDEFKSSAWAQANIDQRCRSYLGIAPERVRIVYDVEEFKGGRWRYEFHAFARTKDPVLHFDGTNGRMTGDLGLMGKTVEVAAKELRERIQDEMDRQVAPGEGVKGAAIVNFGPYKLDRVYGLITIPFRLSK